MKTADLFIGQAYAYDSNEAKDHHIFTQAYVIAHRPKQNKHNYWGPNGNNNTVGIAYSRPYWKDENGQPEWKTKWVRPATLHYDWVTYTDIVNANEARQAQWLAQAEIEKARRQQRVNALPKGVIEALNIYESQREDLVKRGSFTYKMNLDTLEAIVRAVQAISPEKIQEEVRTALALLG